ncbi:MAG: tRNA lysidine(34) synthetase TilS [Candidatus Moranbacteria bacterium CG10_big_fil_rev_8_21_14_0_10_35_21]|nr:MAG: tRNA lysidine(34) synthetase TilS [Candidatus Moranbacteria bacterium CG10_big_fil_rev_8_21_14_0_10_35_21]PJA88644.1 MAG: tRNA lysidine(34) synthetase TilS [Candidatus Moranbacteria bacterium CG_4_9_14_3_um_filter_36_9]
MTKNLTKTIQNTIFQNNLLEKDSRIVLGVSGGPDSVCLLNILFNLQKKYSLELIIAHVNYGLRGKDSEQDERFVKTLAEKYGLEMAILKPKIKAKKNLENNLRDIRYIFFEKIRKNNNFDLIAVAHNLDDQVETFLMRLIRGSGLSGLAGMKYQNEKIIRPLLGTTRKEILEYLKKNKLNYRIDKTNAEDLFLRNKIRNKLIPYLKKEFNPNITETIFAETQSIGEDYDFIFSSAQKYNFSQFLSAKKILSFHPAIQKTILRQKIADLKSNLKNIEVSHIEEILKIIKSTKSKHQVVIFKELKITRKGDKVVIRKIK